MLSPGAVNPSTLMQGRCQLFATAAVLTECGDLEEQSVSQSSTTSKPCEVSEQGGTCTRAFCAARHSVVLQHTICML